MTPLRFGCTTRARAVTIALISIVLGHPTLQAQERPWAHGFGYSVPIPNGFRADSSYNEFAESLWSVGGVFLVQVGRSFPGAAIATINIVPADSADVARTDRDRCRSMAEEFAANQEAEVKGARMVETALGPSCEMAIAWQTNSYAALQRSFVLPYSAWIVTCSYDAGAPEITVRCRQVMDGMRVEPLPWETEIPRFDPDELSRSGAGDTTDLVVDELPQVLSAPQPLYPEPMRLAAIEGTVILAGVVNTAGRVEPGSIRLVEGVHPMLEWAAARAFAGMEFRPGRVQGSPVRVLVQMPIVFSLEDRPPPP